ncbi:DUF1771-domain-containing protein [Ceraceosorus guamensis]|uniref:DUF1771-domain-containing protein n=1 Tax=Ceraceosorus guamensis TaxID=1522189 RepID=A0A316W123_9BASI|nr:DUF1771-domain-containing protein [Ceraceosorus guamensis]PWN42818.1 DUF1771-domain-containing protein [Ceraceosorus guamensis]
MDDVIRFLKAHKGQIIKYGKKLFKAFSNKNKQNQQQGGQGYAPQQQPWQQQQQGGYGGGYAQAPQQQQQPWSPPQQTGHGMPQSHPPGVKPHHGKYDDNQVNQANERYQQLRNQARSEGDQMAKCFDASHKAYSSGDGARAKELSNEGKMHKERMEQLNQEASDWIYKANNEDSGPDEVDLHGLYTAEAIKRTEQAVQQAQQAGKPELRIIVGKGLHSKDHVAHIKPAVEKLMRDYNLAAHLDPHNSGVLVVNLQGQGSRDVGSFTRDLAKHASGDEEQCTIM